MEPRVLDFSAPPEDAITIVFPDGVTTVELPTVDALSLAALQFLTSSGEEWFELFSKPALSSKERARFEHLSSKCVSALLSEAPAEAISSLSSKQKAQVIVNFMTASPEATASLKAIASSEADKKSQTTGS